MKKVVIVLALATLLFAGCTKEKQALIENTWRLKYWDTKVQDPIWDTILADPLSFDIVTLSFIGEDKYIYQTESGCNIARVTIKNNNKINFEFVTAYSGSTLAGYCYILLARMEYYEVNAGDLVLTNDSGEAIKFEKVLYE